MGLRGVLMSYSQFLATAYAMEKSRAPPHYLDSVVDQNPGGDEHISKS